LEGSRAVRNISDRFTATMTNRVRHAAGSCAAQCRMLQPSCCTPVHVAAGKASAACYMVNSLLRPVPHHPLQVRWRDAAEDASPDSPNGSDASSAAALEQQGSVPNTGGSEDSCLAFIPRPNLRMWCLSLGRKAPAIMLCTGTCTVNARCDRACVTMPSGLGASSSAAGSESAANPDSGRLRQLTSDTEIKVPQCSGTLQHLSTLNTMFTSPPPAYYGHVCITTVVQPRQC
jgi:hypothetical protein